MLRFESVFWAANDRAQLSKRLETLGFEISASVRDSHTSAIYFGPEAIEIFSKNDTLSTLADQKGLKEFASQGEGIFGLGLESDDIADDYRKLSTVGQLDKPRLAKEADKGIPLWTGFSLPQTMTPTLRAWVVMNSPQVLHQQAKDVLPVQHPNTCFGIEAVHMVSQAPESAAESWGKIMARQSAGLHWNELARTTGRRIQAGDQFLDFITVQPSTSLAQATHDREGVFMLTLRVTDLELAKNLMKAQGVKPLPCANRDGFIVSGEYTGGPALRFVRSYWKRYLPLINDTYPFGRRTDYWRPLGGAYSSTLEQGYVDDYNH
jgi:hypothetical protein